MISILPIKDKLIKDKIIKEASSIDYNIKSYSDVAVLRAAENEEDLGYIIVGINKIYLKIIDFKIDNKNKHNVILDMLLRSASSYAINRNIFTLQCSNKNLFKHLKNIAPCCEIDNNIYIDIKAYISCKC